MTLAEIVAKANELRPSEYTKDDLTQWVNEVERMAVDQVFEKAFGPIRFEPYHYDLDSEKKLLIPDEYTGCYLTYIFTKADHLNGETNRYNVDAMAFESEWQQFASYFRRHYKPKRRRPHAFFFDRCFVDPFH